MLGENLIHPQRLRSTRQVVERRIPFPQRNRGAEVVQDRQQFAKPPHARVIQQFRRSPALAPKPLQRTGVRTVGIGTAASLSSVSQIPARILHLEKVAAIGASEDRSSLISANTHAATETAQLMQIVVHIKC